MILTVPTTFFIYSEGNKVDSCRIAIGANGDSLPPFGISRSMVGRLDINNLKHSLLNWETIDRGDCITDLPFSRHYTTQILQTKLRTVNSTIAHTSYDAKKHAPASPPLPYISQHGTYNHHSCSHLPKTIIKQAHKLNTNGLATKRTGK